jgi:hypothetical protein
MADAPAAHGLDLFEDANDPRYKLLTKSQRRALVPLTGADYVESMWFDWAGICHVAIGESSEWWMISRRGRTELVDGGAVFEGTR